MRYWIDWLLREPGAVVVVNIGSAGIVLLAGQIGAHLKPVAAGALAAVVFLALSALNVASARRHAEPGHLLYWPGFAIYELAATAAAWATWSLRVST